jgi:hypothetical protein
MSYPIDPSRGLSSLPSLSETLSGSDLLGSVGSLGDVEVQIIQGAPSILTHEAVTSEVQSAPHQSMGRVEIVASPPTARDLAREGLCNREELIERLGAPPKKDIQIFGLTVHRMSTGYKDVLAKLDAYDAAVRACRSGLLEPESLAQRPLTQALGVFEAAQDLEQALLRYEQGRSHSHKAEMRELLAQVQDELQLVDAVATDLANLYEATHEDRLGFELQRLFEFRRIHPDVSIAEVRTLVHKGWSAPDYAAVWQLTLEPHGVSPADVLQAFRLDYDLTTIRAFHNARIPINDSTKPGAEMSGELEKLGAGNFNTVYKGLADLLDGTDMEGVFKEDRYQPWANTMADKVGISRVRPQGACRNIAAFRLDKALSLGLIPRTEIVVHEGRLGTVMGLAAGISPSKKGSIELPVPADVRARFTEDPGLVEAFINEQGFSGGSFDSESGVLKVTHEASQLVMNENGSLLLGSDGDPVFEVQGVDSWVSMDFSDPVLRRDLTKLQWLDSLMGQTDRHAQNYFVQHGANGQVLGVQGIDNDQAFGELITDGSAISQRGFNILLGKLDAFAPLDASATDYGLWGGMLPEVVDRETFTAMMGLKADHIESCTEGLLSESEITATQSRLVSIQTKLSQLEEQGHVVEELDGWSSPEVGSWLGVISDMGSQIEQHKQAYVQTHGREASQSEVDRHMSALFRQATAMGYVARDAFRQESIRMGVQGEGTPMFDFTALSV